VGWLPQMEATGYKFYDTDGTERDCLQLLKDRGMNIQIARVFVNQKGNGCYGFACLKWEQSDD
jgi:arabinogalactan endo-1,4-beta-galactosidase